jgi:hypothetical protein
MSSFNANVLRDVTYRVVACLELAPYDSVPQSYGQGFLADVTGICYHGCPSLKQSAVRELL